MAEETKIAVVTGGSRSLGKNMALRLAGHRTDKVITYHTKAKEAAEVVLAIEALGQKSAESLPSSLLG